MDILGAIFNCIGLIILAIGIVCVYDARKITQKFFSTSNVNESTRTVKIVGFVMFVIGGVIVLL